MIEIRKIQDYKDQEVEVGGWVFNFRSSGSIFFLQLRDGTGFIQAIVSKKEVDPKVWENLGKITIESSVKVRGLATEHPKQKNVFELQVKDLEIIQIAEIIDSVITGNQNDLQQAKNQVEKMCKNYPIS